MKDSSKIFFTFSNCFTDSFKLDKSLFLTLLLAKLHAYTNLAHQLYSGSSSNIFVSL